jgi:hypothetical protein
MSDYLLERALYAAMAAVLIVPEPATFLVLLVFVIGLAGFLVQFAWALLRDSDASASDAVAPTAPDPLT